MQQQAQVIGSPVRLPILLDEMQALAGTIDAVTERVEKLSARLKPLLADGSAQNATALPPKAPEVTTTVPLADEVRRLRNRLQHAKVGLDDIQAKLGI